MVPDRMSSAQMQATAPLAIDIVLKPVSHPELGEISIDDDLFAIGRTEPPFGSYPPAIVDALSRRHARIFSERGKVYVADLDSKNGTTVNGVRVREKPSLLRDGDEVCFGGALCYRIQLGTRQEKRAAAARIVGMTLVPERGDLGLQPVAINRFPFLIGKSDETFARYKDQYPHQVNYLSRRHAHIFLKGGRPYVEDLGSTNGTFVAGRRLDEHAVPLGDGDLLAFGGHHFVYRVRLQKEEALDPTITKIAAQIPGERPADADKTTFVASADSFLDIFCADTAPQPEEEINVEALKPSEDRDTRRKRGRLAVFATEIVDAFAGRERRNLKRALGWAGAAAALILAVALAVYWRGAPEREVTDLLAEGDYAGAAAAADRYLEGHPDNAEVKALGTEALLKAEVPRWTGQVKARDYPGAATTLAAMKSLAGHNADLQSLLGELEWIGRLEQFVGSRGGDQAPIRIYADEDRIREVLKPWDEDSLGHQRALDRISSYVPEFRDFYAEALSHLRKLQSDDSVYLAAIERLKAVITTELNRDRPEALATALKDYGEKYPRLGGLDALDKDLRRYLEIEAEARARHLGRLSALLAQSQFSTPPFQAKARTLLSGGQLPPPEVLRQYEAISRAWREGHSSQALAGLQQLSAGPWADTAARDLVRRKKVTEQFAQLQAGRESPGHEARLLAFFGILDPDEDIYFIRAIEPDLSAHRDPALRRAQDLLNRAQALWSQYREKGAIAEEQRAETSISAQFRSQAQLLSQAQASARQGQRLYALLKAEVPAPGRQVQEEIDREAEQQRLSLLGLRAALPPPLLKEKLALIGERDSEQGASP